MADDKKFENLRRKMAPPLGLDWDEDAPEEAENTKAKKKDNKEK